YKKQDKFEGVNGLGTIEEVFERLSNSITAAKQS
ncbi:MAG TPA: adenylate kinase, partial [Cryomorphaceae bacterium]|nr:adenylate kinase [Cryomorphaceae bacterium]